MKRIAAPRYETVARVDDIALSCAARITPLLPEEGCHEVTGWWEEFHFLNICSMRRVTAKPPNMLIEVSARAATVSPSIQASGRSAPACATSGGATCTSAPMAMMLLIALVTLMSGVCRAGVTFHTTM